MLSAVRACATSFSFSEVSKRALSPLPFILSPSRDSERAGPRTRSRRSAKGGSVPARAVLEKVTVASVKEKKKKRNARDRPSHAKDRHGTAQVCLSSSSIIVVTWYFDGDIPTDQRIL